MNLVREQRDRKLGRNHHPTGFEFDTHEIGPEVVQPRAGYRRMFFSWKIIHFLPFLNECIFLNLRETLRLGRFGYWKFMRLQFGDNVAVAGPVAPILPRQLLVLLLLPPPPPC